MKRRSVFMVCAGFAVLAVAAAYSGAARAGLGEGSDFFPACDGTPVLAYAGTIKDQDGNPVDRASIVISDNALGLHVPVSDSPPGHFCSTDIGELIQNTGETVNPKRVVIVVTKRGYKPLTVQAPIKFGSVKVDLILNKDTDAAS